MSKKLRSKLKRAALAGIALYSANKMLGAKAAAPTGAPPSAKTPSSSKIKKRVVDLKNPGSSIVGKSTKITVDKDALPREIEEKASAVKAKKAEQFKIVKKRKDEGKLSPLMPKSESQFNALTKRNSGLNFMDGAKKGKMIKARGGGLAKGGMRPTKLY
jgi:hypothetical protein|tara:strand:+ start:184 stop:660 length:477 start_codon:yes stop_codon:yes gene_type:complete